MPRIKLTVLSLFGYFIHVQAQAGNWLQCGGIGYSGSTVCAGGWYCQEWNPYYSQCIPPPFTSTTSSRTSSTSSSLTSSTNSPTSISQTLSTSTTVSSSSSSTTPPPSSVFSSSATSTTSTYTGTLPIIPASPTGLASLAASLGKYIGSAYDNTHISDSDYTQLVLSNVNQLTCENSMKWDSIEQTQGDFSTSLWADRVVEISEINGMTMRGHTLVWHSQLPSWVTDGSWNTETLTNVIVNHVTGVMNKYKGKIHTWDVVNEALNEDGTLRQSIFYNILGESYIDLAFNTAKSVDPVPVSMAAYPVFQLFKTVQDSGLQRLQPMNGAGSKSTGVINLVSRLKARNVPVEQIGLQAHLIVGSVPGNLVSVWNSYVALGVSIAITELDIRMNLPPTQALLAQQAADYDRVIDACLQISQCLGITFWGFSNTYSWVESTFEGQGAANPFDENLQPMPAYPAIQSRLGYTPTSTTSSATVTSSTTAVSSTPPPSSVIASSTTSTTPSYTGTLPVYSNLPTGLASLASAYGRYIGSAYDNNHISDSDYTQIVLGNVNQLTCENSMKWNSIEQTQGDFSTSLWADRVVEIAQINGLTMRGHTLVWHSQLPNWVTNGNWDSASLTQVMIDHITGVMNKYKGKIHAWDVVNEAMNEDGTLRQSIFYTTIGETYIDIAFNTAKSIDPDAILAINDYNNEGASSKTTGLVNLVSRVKGRGAPIEQVGIQAHLIVGAVAQNLPTVWQQYTALGVSIAITELDIRMNLPPTNALLVQQAEDYARVVRSCLQVPQCLGVTIWGLSNKYSWVESTFNGQGAACPFNENLQPQPAYPALQTVLQNGP